MFFRSSVLVRLRQITELFGHNAPFCSSANLKLKELTEQKIKVGRYEINCMRVGRGAHVVLCAPGSLGSMWSDYAAQVRGFDRGRFTLLLCDAAGGGKSVSPDDESAVNFFERDANVFYELMKVLEIPRYSYMGWSCSGSSGLILAGKHPEVINKLVVFGTSSYLLPRELENYKKLKDFDNWSKPILDAMTNVYGRENFVRKVNTWVDNVVNNYEKFNCNDSLKKIKCPTLILYGEKDQMVDASHVEYLHKRIKNSRVHLYPEGKHNIHIRYAEDFNKRVQEFFLETAN